ncbi:MAG TPA: aspartate/glutamate racemase family protein [bacterium]|nr:aspartate/glutamate racemase family protein [bacterium]
MITPSSNTVVEPLTSRIFAPLGDAVTFHVSRIRVTRIALDDASVGQFDDAHMLEAASLLADAGMDVIAWNGTSGSWKGLEADRALVARLQTATGVPATTSTLDVLEACRLLGATTCGLATPYLPDVHGAIARTYAGAGLRIAASACLGVTMNSEFAEIPPDRIAALLRQVAVPGAEAILSICTNLAAAAVIEQVERGTGRPVVDSLAATAWRTLRLAGVRTPVSGFGRLLGSDR